MQFKIKFCINLFIYPQISSIGKLEEGIFVSFSLHFSRNPGTVKGRGYICPGTPNSISVMFLTPQNPGISIFCSMLYGSLLYRADISRANPLNNLNTKSMKIGRYLCANLKTRTGRIGRQLCVNLKQGREELENIFVLT